MKFSSYILLFVFITNIRVFASEPITPVPQTIPYDTQKALLGKKLFFETALSKDRSVACISCHNIYNGGADARVVSLGYGGKRGNIQSPSVLNAVFNFRQFWNGRAKNLYEQAKGPLTNPVEHNMTPQLVERRIQEIPSYAKAFKRLYPDGVTFENVIDAIVEFEKTLITPDAKFDRFLRGETRLSPKEQKGYFLFKRYGCISCHNGVNIGGNFFAKIGIFEPYVNQRRYPDRFSITKEAIDVHVFKVPTLRNITLTAPYFHDGSQKTLSSAIEAMARYNLGISIAQEDIEAIEAFLKTLTGTLPKIAYE